MRAENETKTFHGRNTWKRQTTEARAFYREKKQMRGLSNGDRVARAFEGPKINLAFEMSPLHRCIVASLVESSPGSAHA